MGKALIAALLLLAAAAYGQPRQTPLSKLPSDYSLGQAKADGCVVYEDLDVTQGQEQFAGFAERAARGETCAVRLANYYTLGDPSHYAPGVYEALKDEYPVLYVQDLSFDGERYTLRGIDNRKEYSKQYQYLMKYEGPSETPYAEYKSYIRYVLTNDSTVSWEELQWSTYSSLYEDKIDYNTVYTDLIYDT